MGLKQVVILYCHLAFMQKKISEKQYLRLIEKGCTVNLKGFKSESETVEGLIRFDDEFKLVFEKKKVDIKKEKISIPDPIPCPKCTKGTVVKGKTAYGCSAYKEGCNFRYTFENLKANAQGQQLTKELVYKLINGK